MKYILVESGSISTADHFASVFTTAVSATGTYGVVGRSFDGRQLSL